MPTWLPPLLKGQASTLKAALPQGLVSPQPPGLLLCVSDRPPVTPIASLYFIDSLSLSLSPLDNANHSLFLEMNFSLYVAVFPGLFFFFWPCSVSNLPSKVSYS